jgi:dihydroflavonol-4-reductase
MNSNKHKALITGASGIVGSHLTLELLKKGYVVKLLVRNRKNTQAFLQELIDFYALNISIDQSSIEWFEGDLNDIPFLEVAMKDVSAVFHSAAVVSVYNSDTQLMNKVNIEGTANLVNIAKDYGTEWFGFVSSVSTLGPNPDGLVDEDYFWKPGKDHSIYATSKYLSEQEVWRAKEEGLNVLIVNPGVIIGPSNSSRSSARIFYQIQKGLPAFINGSSGYVDARDVASAMVRFWENQISCKRIILSSENLSTEVFLKKLANTFGILPPRRKAAGWILQIAYRLEVIKAFFSRRRPLITKDLIKMASSKNKYDNQKSIDLGVKYRSVDQSLIEIVPFYLRRNQK